MHFSMESAPNSCIVNSVTYLSTWKFTTLTWVCNYTRWHNLQHCEWEALIQKMFVNCAQTCLYIFVPFSSAIAKRTFSVMRRLKYDSALEWEIQVFISKDREVYYFITLFVSAYFVLTWLGQIPARIDKWTIWTETESNKWNNKTREIKR